MLNRRQQRVVRALVEADGTSFATLVALAGLDPTRAFRGADLRGVDFGEVDLNGYDFTDADLTGATFAHARFGGAIFTGAVLKGVRWPRPKLRDPFRDRRLSEMSDMQWGAVDRMVADIQERRRGLSLMPTGTGRSAVLETVIQQIMQKRDFGVLLVDTAAERDWFLPRIERMLGPERVWTSKRGHQLPVRPGLLIQAFSFWGLGTSRWPTVEDTYGRYQAIFTTSVEKVQQLSRGVSGALERPIVATVDNLPIDAGRPDRRTFQNRVKRLFGEPSFVLPIESAVEDGLLEPASIMVSERAAENAEVLRSGSLLADPHHVLRDLAEQIHATIRRTDYSSLVVLCRDDDLCGGLERAMLVEGVAGGMPVTRLGLRWPNGRLPAEPWAMNGIVLMPLSRQAMETARSHPSVAVLAPLSVVRAQDLAFRPTRSATSKPMIHDLADAFVGFPNRHRK